VTSSLIWGDEEKSNFVVRLQCDAVQTAGVEASQVLGVFWPSHLFKMEYGKDPDPKKIETINGEKGVRLDRIPGEKLPMGVYKLKNKFTNFAEKRARLADTAAPGALALPDMISGSLNEARGLAVQTPTAPAYIMVAPEELVDNPDYCPVKRRGKNASTEEDHGDEPWFHNSAFMIGDGRKPARARRVPRNIVQPITDGNAADADGAALPDVDLPPPPKPVPKLPKLPKPPKDVNNWKVQRAHSAKATKITVARAAVDALLTSLNNGISTLKAKFTVALEKEFGKYAALTDRDSVLQLCDDGSGELTDEGLAILADSAKVTARVDAGVRVLNSFQAADCTTPTLDIMQSLHECISTAEDANLAISCYDKGRVLIFQAKFFASVADVNSLMTCWCQRTVGGYIAAVLASLSASARDRIVTWDSIKAAGAPITDRLLTDMLMSVANVIFNGDDMAFAGKVVAAMNAKEMQEAFGATEGNGISLASQVFRFQELSQTQPLQDMRSLRADTKRSESQFLRRFLHLPIGSGIIAAFDKHVASSQKHSVVKTQLDRIFERATCADAVAGVEARNLDVIIDRYGNVRSMLGATTVPSGCGLDDVTNKISSSLQVALDTVKSVHIDAWATALNTVLADPGARNFSLYTCGKCLCSTFVY